jgi:hypothetical protein
MLTILLVWGYSGLLFLTDKSGLAESQAREYQLDSQHTALLLKLSI